jgi:apolipoprotein N-acyltransferase
VSFPKFGHPVFGWISLAPLLVAVAGRGASLPTALPRRALAYGLVTGAVYFFGTLYWTADVMVAFGGLPRAAALPVAGLLVAYLAIYPAIAAWITARAIVAYGSRGLWVAPIAWTAAEFMRGYLFTGFPWVALGYSQATVLPVAQLASVGGVSALSLLVASVSTALAHAIVTPWRRAWPAVAAVASLVAITALWGQWRTSDAALTREGRALEVGIAQGNILQEQKWDVAFSSQILHRYVDLTRSLANGGTRLILWPESATPFFFEEEPAGRSTVLDLARESNAWLLLGSDQMERGAPPRYYNAAFLVSPDGQQVAVYRKMHLVPFGEYVPLRRLLFFAAPLVEGVGDFGEGIEVTRLPVDGHVVTAAICYESVFPYLAREAVHQGSQLLTILTNDAWYGRSSAPYQHYEQGKLRAIETGRYFIRAANTGISAIVDPYGRVIARTALFETATLAGQVRLLGGLTLYARIGDSVAWACVALTLVTWALTRRPRSARAQARTQGVVRP